MSVAIQQCAACQRPYFPDRLLCEQCGANDFRLRDVTGGIVEEFTMLPDGGCLATVRVLDELAVIAAVLGGEPARGLVVRLMASKDDTGETYAYLPGARAGQGTEEELT